MKVLLINGSMHPKTDELAGYLEALADQRREMGDEVRLISLAGRDIHSCIGCYNCWLKTPGICCFRDDQEEILKGVVWSDQTVWASPVSMGFITSAVKNANDRLLPLIHPFLKMNGDRMGHYPRYDLSPESILLLEAGKDPDEETLSIISGMYERFALVETTRKSPEEIAHETYRL